MHEIRSFAAKIARDSTRGRNASALRLFGIWLGGLLVTTLVTSISIAWIDKPTAFLVRDMFGPQHLPDQIVCSPLLSIPLVATLMLVAFGVLAILRRKFSKLEISIPLCGVSVLTSDVIKDGLKFVFGRSWPDSWDPNIVSLIHDNVYGFNFLHDGVIYGSFPSGHAAAVASASSVLWRLFPRLSPMCAILITTVDLGLVLLNLHFVSDVIAGTFLGLSIGLFTVSFVENRESTSSPEPACAYRKSNPAIMVMRSAQDRTAENASGCLDGT
jgi:membrane-associated phospholipid phosphatase